MLVHRAEWYIESFLTEHLTLEGIAEHCRASPFHLTRAFTARRGMPVMRYVWRRRLSSAALALAESDQSVLDVALEAGYSSHEAFTRAFKAEFEVTPSQVRARRDASGLSLTTRPLQTETTPMPRILNPPVVGVAKERTFVGPSVRYDMSTRREIPAQWAAYNRDGVTPAGAVPEAWYGVCHSFSSEGEQFEYLCGVEVEGDAKPPRGQDLVRAPAGKWLRAASQAHVAEMGRAWSELYELWMPELELDLKPSVVIEYYPPTFDGRTGEGGWELWVPVECC